jgi:hypothetical protein
LGIRVQVGLQLQHNFLCGKKWLILAKATTNVFTRLRNFLFLFYNKIYVMRKFLTFVSLRRKYLVIPEKSCFCFILRVVWLYFVVIICNVVFVNLRKYAEKSCRKIFLFYFYGTRQT